MGKVRFSIRAKVISVISLAAGIVMAIGGALTYYESLVMLRKTVVAARIQDVQLLTYSISNIFDMEIAKINTILLDEPSKKAIEAANAKYKTVDPEALQRIFLEIDKEWINAADDSPLIRKYLDTESSTRLKTIIGKHGDISEIFITDRFGGLVASSGRTTDFYQADEEWWQKAFTTGRPYVGKAEYDESSRTLGIAIGVPIRDSAGDIIGVGKAFVGISDFFVPLSTFRIGSSGHTVLTDKEGLIIFHPGIKPLSMNIQNGEKFQAISNGDKQWLIANDRHIHHERIFTCFALVRNPVLLENGVDWILFIEQDLKELYEPLTRFTSQMMVFVPVLMILVICIGYIFGGILTQPISKLIEATKHLSQGDLDYKADLKTGDELEWLGSALNSMTADLKKKMVTIDKLDQEIVERKRVEDRLKKALVELEHSHEELAKARFLSQIGTLAATVAHKLRTPLATIRLATYNIRGKIKDASLHSHFESIDKKILESDKIISNLLYYSSQPEELRRKKISIHALLDGMIEEMKRRYAWQKVSISKKYGLSDDISIEADETLLKELFSNVFNNAYESLADKEGAIEVGTAYGKDGMIKITVKDNGPGMSAEGLRKVFNPFFTTKVSGMGLGLAICAQIARLHKGSIDIQSEQGQGTTVSIILPVAGMQGRS